MVLIDVASSTLPLEPPRGGETRVGGAGGGETRVPRVESKRENEIRDEMHDEMRHMLPNLEWILRASYASPSLVPPLLM